MAQRLKVEVVDDIDQTSPASTVTFGLDGVAYEIDLTDDNAARLRDALAEFVGHARVVKAGAKKRRPAAAATPRRRTDSESERNASIRAWARANGREVSDRGRIASSVIAAYDAANA